MLCDDDALNLLYCYGENISWIRHCVALSRLAKRIGEIMAPKCALAPNTSPLVRFCMISEGIKNA
ncbi:MAG TPA: hypothetical protein VEI57_09955 [Nitrospirota bacterium]|nr:hypothetical protein [Nitrospirota bacterium]